MKDHQNEIIYLRMNIDLTLQTLEDNASLLGQAFYNSGMYDDAIRVYTVYFTLLKQEQIKVLLKTAENIFFVVIGHCLRNSY